VRADHWQIGAGELIESDITTGAATLEIRSPPRGGWQPTARAGAVLALLPVLDLRSAIYTGFRVPTPNELYRPFRAGSDATAANPFLQLEKARGAEGGFDWRPLPAVQLSVTGYANQLNGAIANVTLGTGPGVFPGVGFVAAGGSYRQRLNLEAITVYGVEGDITAGIGAWTLNGTLAWADATVAGKGLSVDLDGLKPAQSPPFMASGTLGWSSGRAEASATLRYVSAQFDDDQNKRRIPPATTLDLGAAYRLWGGLALEFRAENITDAMVVSGVSGDGIIDMAQPRTLWIGLRWVG
jgi:outer membrane receptor protein involved in Fe transport